MLVSRERNRCLQEIAIAPTESILRSKHHYREKGQMPIEIMIGTQPTTSQDCTKLHLCLQQIGMSLKGSVTKLLADSPPGKLTVRHLRSKLLCLQDKGLKGSILCSELHQHTSWNRNPAIKLTCHMLLRPQHKGMGLTGGLQQKSNSRRKRVANMIPQKYTRRQLVQSQFVQSHD